ncbi:unnamed protein product [Adineta ricciae]|uniref:Uncharacterized protein n=1 Tax=Adineta ricciae TaxID=249248 RepID=A0A814UAB8_ADIRI|nr:unnamed protein product [Adineta ricciae]CAF1171943.1 unnamed protein product [Adineta ricciae]
MSLCGLISLNHAMYLSFVLHYLPVDFNIIFNHAFSQMTTTFFVLACVNHYFVCQNKQFLFSFNLYQISIRIIPSVIIFWLCLAIFSTMFDSIAEITYDASQGIDEIIYTIYILISLDIFLSLTSIAFESLT